jgi:GNAT superfamily N-acetyltransferase
VALIIRPLTAQELSAAGRSIRLAFGTFLGAPEPEQFWADLDYAHTCWRADPTAAFGPELDGELVGSNFATRWGSEGLFGPVSVRPDLWGQDIGQRLMEPVMACFRTWGVQHGGCLPLRIVRNMSVCIRNRASGRAFSLPSCQSR